MGGDGAAEVGGGVAGDGLVGADDEAGAVGSWVHGEGTGGGFDCVADWGGGGVLDLDEGG